MSEIKISDKEKFGSLRIEPFTYKGFRFYGGSVSTLMKNCKTTYSYKPPENFRLAKRSMPLSEFRAIYEVGMDHFIGKKIKLSDDVIEKCAKIYLAIHDSMKTKSLNVPIGTFDKETGEEIDDAFKAFEAEKAGTAEQRTKHLYDYRNLYSEVMLDVVEFLSPTDNRRLQTGITTRLGIAGYRPIRFLRNSKFDIKKRTDGHFLKGIEKENNFFYIVPPEGYIIPTDDGLYNPDTGTPFATTRNRKKAIKMLDKKGFDGESEVSKLLVNGDFTKLKAVKHLYSQEMGPFAVDITEDINYVPSDLSDIIFPEQSGVIYVPEGEQEIRGFRPRRR